jgi:hypothetical protein
VIYLNLSETFLILRRIQPGTVVKAGHAVAQLVEALRYNPESRGFDSRCCDLNFSLT